MQLAAGERPASHRIELATTLVVRNSTAPYQPSAAEAGGRPDDRA
jgi:hypothetical protein